MVGDAPGAGREVDDNPAGAVDRLAPTTPVPFSPAGVSRAQRVAAAGAAVGPAAAYPPTTRRQGA